MPDHDRTITSGVTTTVMAVAWGQVQLNHRVQGESVATVQMTRMDALKLFQDLSYALGHHALDGHGKPAP